MKSLLHDLHCQHDKHKKKCNLYFEDCIFLASHFDKQSMHRDIQAGKGTDITDRGLFRKYTSREIYNFYLKLDIQASAQRSPGSARLRQTIVYKAQRFGLTLFFSGHGN